MITQDEIKYLNKQVQIPLLLTFLGGPVPKQMGSKPDWRCNAWWRGGDNPHGVGITYNYEVGKWYITDFTGRSCVNLDLLDFMTKVLGMPFRKALDQLIFASGKDNGYEGSGIDLDHYNLEQPKKLERPEPIDPAIYNTFEKGLHTYWVGRGYTPEIAEKFKLGWCTYGEMKDRLTIPITDERGYLVSVQGRTLDDRIEPKYKFLEGTGESAKLTLYNYGRAFNNALDRGWIGVTEGANAVWRADQYGYQNFVGTLSTSVTDRQLDLLMHVRTNIVIMFDFDGTETMAGQIASISLANRLLQKGHNGVYICNIGFPADPEDLTLDQWTMTLKNAIKYQ